MTRPPSRQRPVQFEFLVGDDTLDGPPAAACDVLRMANQIGAMRGARGPAVAWQWSGYDGRALRRQQGSGTPRRALADIVLVPGWQARNGPHLNRLVRRDAAACERLRAVHAAGGHVLGFYTGVALLGEARLLDDRHAVVPWPFIASTLRHAPTLKLADAVPWTEDNRVWTVDSPAVATQVVLEVLKRCGLADLADGARSVLLHTAERQRLVKGLAQDAGTRIGPGTLERARRWLEDHLHEPYSLADTARAAGTSERSLLRHFGAAFGCTPLQTLHGLRVTRAQMLLETTYLSVEAIAERCGWRDTVMLREVFRRVTGLTPAVYRARFRLRDERRQWGRDLPSGPVGQRHGAAGAKG